MTEDQVRNWQRRRNEAKEIEDPVARQKALDIVYDMKDDMQLDCQRKMADRIKKLIENDASQSTEISEIKTSVEGLSKGFDEDHKTVQEIREGRMKAKGVILALKWLGYIAAAGGGSVITWLLSVANKASGAQ